ncbi:MAG: hypothetical protein AAF649_09570 [Verrucomicrobiota bacterium]
MTENVVAQSGTLDWNSENWTQRWRTGGFLFPSDNNPLTQTFTVSGVDITITLTRGPNTGSGEVSNRRNTPNDVANNPISNPSDTSDEALLVDVNFDSRVDTDNVLYADSYDYIQFDIAFDTPVESVDVEVWDLDLGNSGGSTFQDVILINPSGPDYTLSIADTSDPDVEIYTTADGTQGLRGIGTTDNQGVGTETNNTGAENDDFNSGDAEISFANSDNSTFNSISFRYVSGDGDGSGVSLPANPTLQRIAALSSISFVIPEAESWIAVLLLFMLLVIPRRNFLHRQQRWFYSTFLR